MSEIELPAKVGRKPKVARTIAIDCGALSVPKELQGGIATILEQLLFTLPTIDKRHNYLLYSFAPLEKTLLERFGTRAKNIVLWPSTGYFSLRLPWALQKSHADIFLACSQALPKRAPKTIGFIYDIGFMKEPSLYSNALRMLAQTKLVAQKSAHIITTSQSTATDLEALLHVSKETISVCYPGVPTDCTPEGSRYIGNTPYFLCVGHLKPSKNIPTVIDAFYEFLQKNGSAFQLVLVGSQEGMDRAINEKIEKYGIKSQVSMPGAVSRIELCKYYRGALALLMPSYVEGFGLPALEAMACGAPVVAGSSGSLPEVVDKAALLVDPNDTAALTQLLGKLARSPRLRAQLAKRGLRRAQKFSWKNYSKSILQAIETLTQKEVSTLQ